MILNNVRTLIRNPFPNSRRRHQTGFEMQPVPDHGETSYKGHGRLAGKKR